MWDFIRGGLRTTRTITTTTMAFRMMATARRPTGTIIRTRTITTPATTTQAITRDRCMTIRMATARNRNQTIRSLSQRRNDWLARATTAARQTVCSALRCRKPSGVIKAPTACARLATSTVTRSQLWDYPKVRATKIEIGQCGGGIGARSQGRVAQIVFEEKGAGGDLLREWSHDVIMMGTQKS